MISLLLLLSFIRKISTRTWETGEAGEGGALLWKKSQRIIAARVASGGQEDKVKFGNGFPPDAG